MRKGPKPGDRVIVRAGGREVEGEVIYISNISDPPQAQVEFPIDEETGDTARNMYRVDRIRPVPARAR